MERKEDAELLLLLDERREVRLLLDEARQDAEQRAHPRRIAMLVALGS